MKRIEWKSLCISLLIPLCVGGAAALAIMNSMDQYARLTKPPLSPPSWLFPVVWSVLYLLMGISCYRVVVSGAKSRKTALTVYGIQLAVNFLWPIFFFRTEDFLFSFIWLILLWILIAVMLSQFKTIDKTAALLQIPYLLWVTFAGYLNLGIALLN